ncbi:unannotated protein [freshwater metagenome]|uniref:Unannotated protein n=1 Tax=freshwater metagenome TaxID=449393 RepID=A0A6J6JF20_9ZZZZ|nr:hypothetical protein [Actinomycetota bacterium]
MSIESYGGNPDIVAAREEIQRVAFEIKLCAEELTAWPALETLLSDPIHQLKFRIAAIGIEQKLHRLHTHCILAAENYFTIEAQIQRRFEITFVPELARIISQLIIGPGWQVDRNVKADLVSEQISRKPSSISTILDRLWELSSKDQPTVGIDLLENSAGSKTAIVYIPGTQSFSFGDGSNPLDMASNIQAMGQANQAASEKAVLLAIGQAGISSKDEVIFVGHSQGGMVAGNLAANPIGFISAGLITFGAPLAQLRNLKVPVMAVEHVNDPVPNLSGKTNPLKKNWVTIQRLSNKSESNAVMFSHSLKSYKNTSVEIDSSSDVGVKNIKSQLLQKVEGTKPSKSFEFRISRAFR